jgi:hypothetical protein
MLTIKELAGHRTLETTMRYMHLASAAPRAGIDALERDAGNLGAHPRDGDDERQRRRVVK